MVTIESLEIRRLLALSFDYAAAFGDKETLDTGNAVVVDAAGNTYFGGTFRGKIDVNKSNHGVKNLNAVDNYDAFLVKYDPTGKLLWSRQIGTDNGDEAIEHLVIGPNGDVYATGQFEETVDFDPGKGVHALESHGKRDAFILHLTSGGKYVWAGNIGGERDDDITALAIGPTGDMYYSGFVRLSGDADPTNKVRSIVDRGVDDTIIARLNGKNGAIKWLKVFGENQTRETVFGLAVDGGGDLTAAGMLNDPVAFDRQNRSFDREPVGSDDVYIARLNSRGDYQYIKTFGGKKQETVVDLVQDAGGNLYLTGNFSKTADFDPGSGQSFMEAPGDSAVYILKLDSNANFTWARQIGEAIINGHSEDGRILARGLAVDPAGNVYTVGDFAGTIDFDPGSALRIIDVEKSNNTPAIPTQLESSDAYVQKLDADGNLVDISHFGGEDGSVLPHDVAVDSSGGINIVGAYAEFVDLNPTSGNFRRSTQEDRKDTDVFLVKLLG